MLHNSYSKSKGPDLLPHYHTKKYNIIISSVSCLGLFLIPMPPAVNLVTDAGSVLHTSNQIYLGEMQGTKTLSLYLPARIHMNIFSPLVLCVSLSGVHSGVFPMYHFFLHTHSVGYEIYPTFGYKRHQLIPTQLIELNVSIKLPLILSAKRTVDINTCKIANKYNHIYKGKYY